MPPVPGTERVSRSKPFRLGRGAVRLARAVGRGIGMLREPVVPEGDRGQLPAAAPQPAVPVNSKPFENRYLNEEEMRRVTCAGRHREAIGGRWEEIGKLQLDFLISQGLLPEHKLLDVGCGCLRAGVHLVRYLQPGHYYGIDVSPALLKAGEAELAAVGLGDRLPRENLLCTSDFDVSAFDARFDFALAQSVFTHLSLNHLRLCLNHVAARMRPGGRFYISFFEVPAPGPVPDAFCHGQITSFTARDPFHYPFRDFEHFAVGTAWRAQYVGLWGHSRNLRMMYYEFAADEASLPAPKPSTA